jgi:nitrogen-specific signal transduction histidine kinase
MAIESDKTEQLPQWEASQIKLISQLAHEFVLPLSFASQVNQLFNIDPEARNNDQLVAAAKRQFDDYLNLVESLELLQSNLRQQTPLIPLNPTAVIEEVAQNFQPRLAAHGHRLKVHGNHQVLALGNSAALKNALISLLKNIESTTGSHSLIELEVKSSRAGILINLSNTKSTLTRPQIKKLINQSGHYRQPLIESGASALPIVLAQELTHSIKGQLNFYRIHGRALWTISLLKSRQLALWG